jgi:CRISPR-associated protein Cmr4
MTHANALLGLYAQTSVHAGAGSSMGIVDLPIQREGFNGWPCVFGSAVKGALRAHAEQQPGESSESIRAVFGPDSSNANSSEHAGALLVGDARLLLLPVRSLTTHFKWVTCPEGLARLKRDAWRLDLRNEFDFDMPEPPSHEVAWVSGDAQTLFLEEYRFVAQHKNLDKIIEAIAPLMTREDARGALKARLVIVGDDRFHELAQHATPVAAHVRLDSQTKTVTPGALWYEETLPAETLLTVALSAVRARWEKADMSAGDVLATVLSLIPPDRPWLQLGGNETVGMGWCAVAALIRQG